MSKVTDAANAVAAVATAVPIYQDLFQPAVRELGKGVHTLSKTVHIALSPVSALVWGYDQIKNYVQTTVEKKLQNVPQENIIVPDPIVVGPAVEALRYTAHKEELREMFANLIATAMDKEKALKAHPSYVEIIKQLSPDEARMLSSIKGNGLLPIIDLRAGKPNGEIGFFEIKKHFTDLAYVAGCSNPELGSAYIENLNRLGLIFIDKETYLIDHEMYYDELINHSEIKSLFPMITSMSRTIDFRKYSFTRTEFGENFVNACIRY
ncbi:DUF4393 domain-containing protein [Bacillus sp. CGMCC 1.16607]|uniref:DUF4393 domain-containing protein n=1 Tax=Bacillus sp. CGMCC 1.16607 TaxID=3351842 RepID=UPI00363A5721